MRIYKIANSYIRSDYGSWICNDGRIHRVIYNGCHIKELTTIFKNEDIDDDPDYDNASNWGFIRVVNIPLCFEFGLSLSQEQKDIMINLINEYRGTVVYINNKGFNKKTEIDEIYKLIENT